LLATPVGAQEAPPTTTPAPATVAPVPATVPPGPAAVTPPTPVETPPTTATVPGTVATVPEPSDGAATAPEGARSISGTIRGVDGRYVNAQISLVLRDSLGRFLRIDGSVNPNAAQYATTVSINPDAPLEGSESDTAGYTDTWTI